nr:hypothetical protein [Nostoc sp. EkiNYC01]
MEPTPEQLKSLYQRSLRVTALLLPINYTFQHYLNIIRSRPGVLCITDEEFEAELQKRINSSYQQS